MWEKYQSGEEDEKFPFAKFCKKKYTKSESCEEVEHLFKRARDLLALE
jgi:hypothetical protein